MDQFIYANKNANANALFNVSRAMDSWLIRSNVAVKMFAEGGKPENPEKNPPSQIEINNQF